MMGIGIPRKSNSSERMGFSGLKEMCGVLVVALLATEGRGPTGDKGTDQQGHEQP